uniref:F-box domain-containing protein n=1 Tax=Strigamia maritima TaxID=126957 RepID=T1J4H9_STRMM
MQSVIKSTPTKKSISDHQLKIIDLPREILEKFFSYVSFEQISKSRLVCKQFELICSSMLNTSFYRVQAIMLSRFQAIKAQMPRRESARRKHPAAREYDIVETMHMRLTLLQMSFGKHIERKHCCFFAGEILDEVYRILRYMKTTPTLARAYKVTDELFDLSTMAMEYFKEQIEPSLPEIKYFGSEFLTTLPSSRSSRSWKMLDTPGPSTSTSSSSFDWSLLNEETSEPSDSDDRLNKKLNYVQQIMKKQEKRHWKLVRDVKKYQTLMKAQKNRIKELTNRLDECNKKEEETSNKFNAILQEVNKCKTELQYWRSKSPANQICSICSTESDDNDRSPMKQNCGSESCVTNSPSINQDFVPIITANTDNRNTSVNVPYSKYMSEESEQPLTKRLKRDVEFENS